MPAVFAAIVAIGYACYSSVGFGVFGYLPGYAHEEGLDSGTRFFLLTLANRSLHSAIPMAAYTWRPAPSSWPPSASGPSVAEAAPYAFILSALVIATMLNVFYSPHYPWYYLWLLPYLAIVPWHVPPSYPRRRRHLPVRNQPRSARRANAYHLNILLYSGFAVMTTYDCVAQLSGCD